MKEEKDIQAFGQEKVKLSSVEDHGKEELDKTVQFHGYYLKVAV